MNYSYSGFYDPIFERSYTMYKKIYGKEYMIEILDTEENEEIPGIMDRWIKKGQGFLLVFSINDYESFERIKRIYDKILRTKQSKICPILLVGNKLDLENERVVSYSEAKELADSWRVEYYEVSSRNGSNCQIILEKIIEEIIDLPPHPYPPFRPPFFLICISLCFSICYYSCCCFLCISR